jgi:hypothetical protein
VSKQGSENTYDGLRARWPRSLTISNDRDGPSSSSSSLFRVTLPARNPSTSAHAEGRRGASWTSVTDFESCALRALVAAILAVEEERTTRMHHPADPELARATALQRVRRYARGDPIGRTGHGGSAARARITKAGVAEIMMRTMQDYLRHRDPRHTVHYTRVSGRRFEGLWK